MEDTGSTRQCRSCSNLSLEATSTVQDDFRGESVWESRKEVLAALIRALNPAGYLACSRFHGNSAEWMDEVPQ